VQLSRRDSRRLAISAQRLDAPRPKRPDAAAILALVRHLGCLQLDPTAVVARNHLLVLWSRLGNFDRRLVDQLLWKDRSLFEYWAHVASIVPTSDLEFHVPMMRAERSGGGLWGEERRKWAADNSELRERILAQLQAGGPLAAGKIEDVSVRPWKSTGWTNGRNVDRMLSILWLDGEVMVAGRTGSARIWDLAERILPPFPEPRPDGTSRAVQRSLRALGVASARQITAHFIRNRYPGIQDALAGLVETGRIHRASIEGVKGDFYVHDGDLDLVERIQAGDWKGRTTLLSPFDNLVADRERTRQLFDFEFTLEIYVPPPKRRWGYFVMPVLHGDRLVDRLDLAVDRKKRVLEVKRSTPEPDLPGAGPFSRPCTNSPPSPAPTAWTPGCWAPSSSCRRFEVRRAGGGCGAPASSLMWQQIRLQEPLPSPMCQQIRLQEHLSSPMCQQIRLREARRQDTAPRHQARQPRPP